MGNMTRIVFGKASFQVGGEANVTAFGMWYASYDVSVEHIWFETTKKGCCFLSLRFFNSPCNALKYVIFSSSFALCECFGGQKREAFLEHIGLEPMTFCMPCRRSSQTELMPHQLKHIYKVT